MLKKDVVEADGNLAKMVKATEFLRDMAARFHHDGPSVNIFERSINEQIRAAEDQVAAIETARNGRLLALELIAEYRFDFEPATWPMTQYEVKSWDGTQEALKREVTRRGVVMDVGFGPANTIFR